MPGRVLAVLFSGLTVILALQSTVKHEMALLRQSMKEHKTEMMTGAEMVEKRVETRLTELRTGAEKVEKRVETRLTELRIDLSQLRTELQQMEARLGQQIADKHQHGQGGWLKKLLK